MISVYFFEDPANWIIPWIIQAVTYFFLLKKMQLNRWTCIIPFLAERQFSKLLFRRLRSFYRPFVIAAVFALAGWYLDPSVGMGKAFMWVAFVIYGIFLIRLYWRMGLAMGKGLIFRILMILFPPLFLLILGLGRSQYRPLPLKPLPQYSRAGSILRKVALVVISAAEICVLVLGVGFLTIRTTPPAILVNEQLNEIYEMTKDVTGTGNVVSREDAMGAAAASIPDMKISRDHFFPSHANDKNVVVMTYIVGSNLEDKGGMATANIRQMMDATEQGDALTFVVEAGGSNRWFTKGIENRSVGRYTVAGGKVDKVEALPSDTCMSEGKNLQDFISWTKENYPADRYMLVLWDHGGGVAYGYGEDDLNKKPVADDEQTTMNTSEVVDAIAKAGVTFDVIGFDACLMQDIEIAYALEPYADYYLASEETEGGYGWFYTSGFGKLAADPTISSEEFGHEMIACYDPYNTIIKDDDGKPDTGATLSFVDLTLAAPAYEIMTGLLRQTGDVVKDDPVNFAAVATAANSAYAFYDDVQIDLIDFLKVLDKADYEDAIGTHQDKTALYRALQACVLYRNGDSARGINGMAVALPYKNMMHYDATSKQLKAMSAKAEKKTFDEIFSIMAAQQKKDHDKKAKEKKGHQDLFSIIEEMGYVDYTQEDWYIKGFEDYDQTKALVDIPLVETEDGYKVELPEKAWRIVNDCKTMVYQMTPGEANGAVMRYLGCDYIGVDGPDGHPMVTMDDNWIYIDGALVCYEAQSVRETEDGDIFTGDVRACLNGEEDIVLHIEWDPVTEESDAPMTGQITGYDMETIWDTLLDTKSTKNLEAGDSIQFIFDYYDAEGNLVTTKPDGKKIRVTKQSRIKVTDEPLEECDISFGGVLADIYQRVMTTELIETHVGGAQ